MATARSKNLAVPEAGTIAARWIQTGLATGPTDRAAAEAGVVQAYRAAGLAAPDRMIWCGSPAHGAITAAECAANGSAGHSVRPDLRTRPWAAARAELLRALGPQGWAELWATTGAIVWRLVVDRICTPLGTHLRQERPQSNAVLLDAVHGQHDAGWLAAFDAAPDPASPAVARLSGLAAVARASGWWWPYQRVAVLTELPTTLARDNLGRLHSGDGPAIAYPDGFGLHAWRGMPIPVSLVDELPRLTFQRIAAEPNAELRRVMLEWFGYDRYLREAGGTRVSTDEFGTLWRLGFADDEPLLMVEVVNATLEPDGTRRTYHLRVPPDTRTAKAGVAWTFGLTAEEYHPLVQT